MVHRIKALAVSTGATLVFVSFASHVKIMLLKQDPQAGDPLNRFNLTIDGSIRSQFNMMSDDGDKGPYRRNGFDDDTRFRLAAGYYLFDDISWINYYKLGVDIPALFNWDNHYAEGINNTARRVPYVSLKSDTQGTLTYGQQNSIYYDVVRVRTGIQDYDMIGQALGSGISGDYDDSYRSRNMLKCKKTVGNADLYGSYLFGDSEYLPGNGLCYKRKGGNSIDVNYHIMKDPTWDAAWNYARAEVRDPSSVDNKIYDQNIIGTALSWIPDNWAFSFDGGWYQNFLTIKKTDVHNYFTGDAQGIEHFVGYRFPINQYTVKSIQPYFTGDRLQCVNGHNYQHIDSGPGISSQPDYGFHVDYEHVFTSSTDNLGDMNLVCLRYDF